MKSILDNMTLEQLEERARLNALRGIATSQELRDEIARRKRVTVKRVGHKTMAVSVRPCEQGAWVVRCRVSGGVTGTRQSVCKQNGEPIYFATRAEAQAYADKRLQETQGNPYRVANFEYWVADAEADDPGRTE